MLTSDHSRPSQQTLTHTAQQTAERELVLAAVQTLSIEHRVVLLECYYRGASVAEVADTLGVTADAVKSRTHHALRALRQALALSTNDPPGDDPRCAPRGAPDAPLRDTRSSA
jgi:DNA-directed RNA polymerase specialized sigma24 family protein